MSALATLLDLDDAPRPDDVEVYSFAALSPRAKERARSDYRENGIRDDWWDSVYEDADLIARMMGIQIDAPQHRMANGKLVIEPAIYFSGFSSQGDGACFTGDWHPVQNPLASLSAVMEHAPNDDRLHEIAFALAHMSERCNALIPDARVKIERGRSQYCHEHSVTMEADLPTPERVDWHNELQLMTWNALCIHHGLVYEQFEQEAADTLRAFMKWIYRQLEAEHDYLTSDESVDEALADLKFDEEGDWLP